MTKKVWHSLLEVTQPNSPGSDQVLIEHLARAVAELNLSPAVLEQVQTGVANAIRRAWQHDVAGVVDLTVAALVLRVEGSQAAQNWGFFLVEKRQRQAANRRIEVLLYPEQE